MNPWLDDIMKGNQDEGFGKLEKIEFILLFIWRVLTEQLEEA